MGKAQSSIGKNIFSPLSANPTNWSKKLKQFVGKSSLFGHFVELALKRLKELNISTANIWKPQTETEPSVF